MRENFQNERERSRQVKGEAGVAIEMRELVPISASSGSMFGAKWELRVLCVFVCAVRMHN